MAETSPREIRCDIRSPELLRELVEQPLPLNLGAPRPERRFFVMSISTRLTDGCTGTA